MSSLSDERCFRDAWRRMKTGLPWGAGVVAALVAMPAAAKFRGEGLAMIALMMLAVVAAMAAPLVLVITVSLKRSGANFFGAAAIIAAITAIPSLFLGPGMLMFLLSVLPTFLITWCLTNGPSVP